MSLDSIILKGGECQITHFAQHANPAVNAIMNAMFATGASAGLAASQANDVGAQAIAAVSGLGGAIGRG